MRPPLIGFLIGLGCTAFWFAAWFLPFKLEWDFWLVEFLVLISTPVAHLIAATMGWTLHQEAGLFIYAFLAIPITMPLVGLFIGLSISVTKKLLHKRR